MSLSETAEFQRLQEDRAKKAHWRLWGPYVSDRQWGTVREDYSADGAAWEYFPHDHARSRAYRWGEDGIAGLSDDQQRLCLSLALWNGKDPILKERLFGLTNSEGNHGEDVKELYYYLDATPTHSYLKMLYKYPQAAFPYADLVNENRRRGIGGAEYELIDSGVFDADRWRVGLSHTAYRAAILLSGDVLGAFERIARTDRRLAAAATVSPDELCKAARANPEVVDMINFALGEELAGLERRLSGN